MEKIALIDLIVITVYMLGVIGIGFYFSRKNKSAQHFTTASGLIPGWAIGLSIYATFLSTNTFLGVPGKAFGGNWNFFVFALSIPLAAWVASRYFIPFYRTSGEISTYTHLEKRFGKWARTFAVVCFLLTQLARMGTIFFGVALTIQALTNVDMTTIMIVSGICITIYTLLGGIEAVIWTEVVQAVLKTGGAIVIMLLLIKNIPRGIPQIIETGIAHQKFSLGSFSFDLTTSSFWVVLLYGFLINLNNFGMDQNYVQRYHTARSEKEARKSVWLCVFLYVPVSLLFLFIGSSLYTYYTTTPNLLNEVQLQAALEKMPGGSPAQLAQLASTLKPEDIGDKVLPHFLVHKVPVGLLGLIIAAILSAAMSTISSNMNASATVFLEDIYERFFHLGMSSRKKLNFLYLATGLIGLSGMLVGISFIGTRSIMDIWWDLSGVFAGGMLGLFLLGFISRTAKNHNAILATIVGILVILWMSLSKFFPSDAAFLKSPFHSNMIIVIGTLTIFLVGNIGSKFNKNKRKIEVADLSAMGVEGKVAR